MAALQSPAPSARHVSRADSICTGGRTDYRRRRLWGLRRCQEGEGRREQGGGKDAMSSKHYKKCYRCGGVKLLSYFHRNAGKADGLADECKPCRIEVSAAYDAKHAETVTPRRRAYARNYMRERARDSRRRRERPNASPLQRDCAAASGKRHPRRHGPV
jgi:hypothetical protein